MQPNTFPTTNLSAERGNKWANHFVFALRNTFTIWYSYYMDSYVKVAVLDSLEEEEPAGQKSLACRLLIVSNRKHDNVRHPVAISCQQQFSQFLLID